MQDRFKQVVSDMNQLCLERQSEVYSMVGCIIAHEHGFFLGKPGIGKSHMINKFLESTVDANKFVKLMTAQTTVNELFGPLDINAFKQGKLSFNVEGYLADSHIAFLDEVWKSNSQCLNALLTVLEERRFDNGNQTIQAPLISCFGASNELPQDDSLKALYDRFLLRMEVKTLLQRESYRALYSGLTHSMRQVLSVNDIREANAQSSMVTMGEDVCDSMIDLVLDIGLKCKIDISPRRQVKMIRFLKALVWLDGKDKITENYFQYLLDCIWETPSQKQSVAIVLSSYLSPAVQAAKNDYDVAIALIDSAINQSNLALFIKEYHVIQEQLKTIEDKVNRGDDDSPHVERTLLVLKAAFKPLNKKYLKLRKL